MPINIGLTASNCMLAVVWTWTQRQTHYRASTLWSSRAVRHLIGPSLVTLWGIGDDPRTCWFHFSGVWGWAAWDDLMNGDGEGQVCGGREIRRIFCMRWGIEEKLNREKVFGREKESPSNASNIFRVIETRLDFWCLSGSFITVDGPTTNGKLF